MTVEQVKEIINTTLKVKELGYKGFTAEDVFDRISSTLPYNMAIGEGAVICSIKRAFEECDRLHNITPIRTPFLDLVS